MPLKKETVMPVLANPACTRRPGAGTIDKVYQCIRRKADPETRRFVASPTEIMAETGLSRSSVARAFRSLRMEGRLESVFVPNPNVPGVGNTVYVLK